MQEHVSQDEHQPLPTPHADQSRAATATATKDATKQKSPSPPTVVKTASGASRNREALESELREAGCTVTRCARRTSDDRLNIQVVDPTSNRRFRSLMAAARFLGIREAREHASHREQEPKGTHPDEQEGEIRAAVCADDMPADDATMLEPIPQSSAGEASSSRIAPSTVWVPRWPTPCTNCGRSLAADDERRNSGGWWACGGGLYDACLDRRRRSDLELSVLPRSSRSQGLRAECELAYGRKLRA